MTEQEKKVALDNIYRELWYKNYIDMLIKAYDIPKETFELLAKVSKPDVTAEVLEETFTKTYALEKTEVTKK